MGNEKKDIILSVSTCNDMVKVLFHFQSFSYFSFFISFCLFYGLKKAKQIVMGLEQRDNYSKNLFFFKKKKLKNILKESFLAFFSSIFSISFMAFTIRLRYSICSSSSSAVSMHLSCSSLLKPFHSATLRKSSMVP